MSTNSSIDASTRTAHQVRVYGPTPIEGWGVGAQLEAAVRFDDQCNNGYNSFGITGEVRRPGRVGIEAGGCFHEEIGKAFPELAPLIRWHHMGADGPLHYVANTLYWLGYDTRWADARSGNPPNLEHARRSAIWPDLPVSLLAPGAGAPDLLHRRASVELVLLDRLPMLIAEFRAVVESLGLTF